MKIVLKTLVLNLIVALSVMPARAQKKYSDFKTLSDNINSLAERYPSVCKVNPLCRTAAGRDIWLITAGAGDTGSKPGVAVIGGVEGNHLLGCELAYGFAEKLMQNSNLPEVKNLLERVTFYIFPDVSPDATEQFFAPLRYERTVNSRPVDDDRDFKTDEDPYDDIDNNGIISMMRIADPAGKYRESAADKRIMAEADLSKGETGGYLLFSEGIDNDKDGSFNEDGDGGVDFNRNLTFGYEAFGNGSGAYPVSEPETKALLDFLFDRFNIYAVFTFGPQDNLGQPWKAAETKELPGNNQQDGSEWRPSRRDNMKITSVFKSDELINKLVSGKYHEITGAKGAPQVNPEPGNFAEWAYFHYGRYSFTTPGWWFPVGKDENPAVAFLKFAERNGISDVFLPWTPVDHPDFPGKKVETGGIKPFAMTNPPADTLSYLVDSHYRFITYIAGLHPDLEFIDLKTEKAGGDIFRITALVHNKGVFATCTEAGDSNLWTRIMRIEIVPEKDQTLVSGQRIQRIRRLQGDETAEFSWLIGGSGTVQIKAGAVNTGTINTSVSLK